MSADRSWMYNRLIPKGTTITYAFRMGVAEFLKFAANDKSMDSNNMIRCPCPKCKNLNWKALDDVKYDLFRYGFLEGYHVWNFHGEEYEQVAEETYQYEHHERPAGNDNIYCAVEMLMDAARLPDMSCFQNSQENGRDQLPHGDASRFYKVLEDAAMPLHPTNTKFTRLSFITKLLHFKNMYGCSERGFDELLELIGSILPEDHTLPKSYYEVRKMVKELNLGYQKIHACENDCMLFYGDNRDNLQCDICGTNRYQDKTKADQKDIPRKILRYFPLIPRLQRLFMSSHTAEHMKWYKLRNKQQGELTHPSDGEEWKRFDSMHPSFSEEIRNVRLGLATDGFCPFNNGYAKQYSVWPVILVVYNLPPSMSMKDPYMFMTLLIPGEKSPTKDINIYLRPLIEELKMLWDVGVQTFDKSSKENFTLRAALLWTINDFPAYGMVSGWSTHGKLACPVCMGDAPGFQLKHGGKCSFFGTSRLFLDDNDPLRRNSKFGRFEKRSVKGRYSGEEVMNKLESFQFPPPGKSHSKERANGYGKTHNWTHLSIFFELPYWKTLTLRHCIDVMHTEKNVFDNIFYTVLDDGNKTKDGPKARLDLMHMKIRKELWLQPNGRKPKAKYTISKDQLLQLCDWVSKLKFPDGYVSNIARCSKVDQGKFQGMKSHDCHVFLQKLMPIAFRELLPRDVVDNLSGISNFFRNISSTVLKVEDLDKLEKDIVKIMCKLETIFPPSFFDSMEHLSLHLPMECKLGGPVHFRWMYPFERMMRKMKMKVKNKARVEGSIAEQYTEEELVNFCSLYFESDVYTVHNQLRRNEVASSTTDSNLLEAYTYPVKLYSPEKDRYLDDDELKIIENYVLLNMPEVAPFLEAFEALVYASYPSTTAEEMESLTKKKFKRWFRKKVEKDPTDLARFQELIKGPLRLITPFKACICNGYKFKCGDLTKLTSSSSGVLVQGSCYTNLLDNYYGRLQEVVRVNYEAGYQVILFKCHWFDTSEKHRMMDRNGVVTVDVKSRLRSDDIFILASQASQVYYAPNVVNPRSTWYTVVTTKSLPLDETTSAASESAFQEDVSNAEILSSSQINFEFFSEDINDISNENEEENSGDQFVIVGDEDDERTDGEDEEEARDVDDFSDNDGFEDIY
ncbi:unnamed protein product [Rhodiola kirilowii]